MTSTNSAVLSSILEIFFCLSFAERMESIKLVVVVPKGSRLFSIDVLNFLNPSSYSNPSTSGTAIIVGTIDDSALWKIREQIDWILT